MLRDKSFSKMTLEDFEFVLQVHLLGTFKPTHAIFPIMKEQNYGRILVTTSSSGRYGNFGQTNYGAGKTGVVGLMNTLKLEGEKYNIRINALMPIAWTRMSANIFPPETEPMLHPKFVTPAALFMCSDDAPTGKIISAGAGVFAASYMMESKGAFLGADATADDIAKNWESLSDPKSAAPINSGMEHSLKFFEIFKKHNPDKQ